VTGEGERPAHDSAPLDQLRRGLRFSREERHRRRGRLEELIREVEVAEVRFDEADEDVRTYERDLEAMEMMYDRWAEEAEAE